MIREEKPREDSTRVDSLSAETRDELHRVLSWQLCRRTLTYLLENNESTVDELAEVLCGWEAADGVVSAERYRQIRITLHHQHLPRLAMAGLVRYTPEDNHVVLADIDAPRREFLQQYLELEPE